VRYAFIESLVNEFAIVKMCRWLEVSRSGFYKWRKRVPSAQRLNCELVRQAMIITFHEQKERYGAPRLTVELNEAGVPCSVNHIAKLLSEEGLRARNGKNFKYSPSGKASNNIAENLLNRQFYAERPNEKWVSDITYIPLEVATFIWR